MNEDQGRGPLRSDRIVDAQLRNDLGARPLPGSDGEHRLQEAYSRTGSALAFYRNQVLDYLNSAMQVFIGRQEMMFVATADKHGEADASFRAGTPGFVRVLDERTIAYPRVSGEWRDGKSGKSHRESSSGNPVHRLHRRQDWSSRERTRARIAENEELLKDSSTPKSSARIHCSPKVLGPNAGLWCQWLRLMCIAPNTFRGCGSWTRLFNGALTMGAPRAATISGRSPPDATNRSS